MVSGDITKPRADPPISKHVSKVSREIVDHIHPPFAYRLSNLSKKYLGEIIQKIHASAQSYKHTRLHFEPIHTNHSFWKKVRQSHLYRAIPEEICKTIESRPSIGRKYTFSIGDGDAQKQVAVYLVLPKPESSEDPYSRIFHSTKLANRFFESSIRRIVVWLGVAFRFGGHMCAQTLDAYLFLTDHRKRLPNSRQTNDSSITLQHANTALTTACSPDSDIVLFRAEEWFKVFIHETFHSLGIDFSQMDVDESNRQITQMFLGCTPELDVRLYETYCEMWAEIINVLMISYFSKVDGDVFPKYSGVGQTKRKTPKSRKSRKNRPTTPDISQIVSIAERHLQYERTFTMIQAGKVLKHHGMTYRDLCRGTPHLPKYRESTNVFSYYVLKSILMYHLNEFIEWCFIHTGSRETPTLFFPKSPDSIREYGELIGRLYQSDEFIKTLERHQHGGGGIPEFLNDTLRMTVFEA